MAEEIKSDIDDPVEYLLNQAEFHDCHLTVGDPTTDEVEEVHVVRSQLVAHSSVFRDMLLDSHLSDPTGCNTHIKDIRPQIFKLMLKHMYGGSLQELKIMPKEKVVELALCADKYNVQRLLEKACKQMIPKSVEEVFIPLRFVAYVPSSVLMPSVTKLVQEETEKVIKHNAFLNLDDICVEFIAKQDKLALDEVDLWRALVKWGKHKGQGSNLTLKEIIEKPLAYIRFTSLTIDQIINEVLSTEILNPVEALKLITSLVNSLPIDIPGLCKGLKKREKFSISSDTEQNVDKWRYEGQWFISLSWPQQKLERCDVLEDESMLTIENISECRDGVAITSLVFESRGLNDIHEAAYKYSCEVTMVQNVNGYAANTFRVRAEGNVVCGENVVMPLRSSKGTYCIIEPRASYKMFLKFSSGHPVYRFETASKKVLSDCGRRDSCIHVNFRGKYFHVLKINYKLKY